MSTKIGLLIKDARIKHGLSQRQLAKLIGISQSYIGKIEIGEKNPGLSVMHKLEELFNIDNGELFAAANFSSYNNLD